MLFLRCKCPCNASAYSRSSQTYPKLRSGSARSCSCSRSCGRSQSRSSWRLPPYPRRGQGNYDSRSRSHSYERSRPRSPPYRRYPSRSRSPLFRGQSPTERTIAQGEGEREYLNIYTEVLPCGMKAYCGRSLAFLPSDPLQTCSFSLPVPSGLLIPTSCL